MNTTTPFKIALCMLMFITGLYIGYTTGYQAGYNTGWYVGEGDGFINAKHFEYAGYEKGIELGTLKTIAYYEQVPFNFTDAEKTFFEEQQRKINNVLNESPVYVSVPIVVTPYILIYDHMLNESERKAIYEGGMWDIEPDLNVTDLEYINT